MKALVYHGPGKIAWEEKKHPSIQEPGDAVVRIITSTICGTDLHILKGDLPLVTVGPGEAKGEFEKRLAHAHYKGRVVGVEPADRMTEPQIVAKVRDHYFDQLEAKYASGS